MSSEDLSKSAGNARFAHIYWTNTRLKTSKSPIFFLVKCVFLMALYVIHCFYHSSHSFICASFFVATKVQKQPSIDVLIKRCSENMQQIYRRTPTPKCDFNKVANHLYYNHTSAWLFSCKFAAYLQNTFL